MLFFMATRDMSSMVALRVREVLRVGDEVSIRFAEDGILERRLLVGDVDTFFCFRTDDRFEALRSGPVVNDGNVGNAPGAVFVVFSNVVGRC